MDICSFYEGLGRVAEYLNIASIAQLSDKNTEHNASTQFNTIQEYLEMDGMAPMERKQRMDWLFNASQTRKGSMDPMCVFGEEYYSTSEKNSLGGKLSSLLGYIHDMYSNERKE